jgi:hypothetical protein
LKKILSLIKTHAEEDFQFNYYITIIFFLAASLLLNYSVDLENSLIDRQTENFVRILLYFFLYGFGYYITCLIVSYFNKVNVFWGSKKFWLFSLFGLSVLSIDKGFVYLPAVMNLPNQPYDVYAWLFKIATSATSFALVLLPLLLFYQTMDKEKSGFYGITTSSNIKPYLYLLLIVAPFIFTAALQTSFTDYYPVYKTNKVSELWGWPSYLPMMIFEFIYGADFLNVELLFRGFFVIGIAQIMGTHSIMPMVVIYCFLHFGKPAGEAVSSIIGGYIIGIIALYTRSLRGGIIIHVGIAWLMETAAYFAKQF